MRRRQRSTQLERLLAAAIETSGKISALTTDVDELLLQLPRNTRKDIRDDLADFSARLVGIGSNLQQELDRLAPDPDSLRLHAGLAARAVKVLVNGTVGTAVVSGLFQGLGAESIQAVLDDSRALEASCIMIERHYYQLPEIRRDLVDDVRDELRDELRDDLEEDLREEIEREVRDELNRDRGAGVPNDRSSRGQVGPTRGPRFEARDRRESGRSWGVGG